MLGISSAMQQSLELQATTINQKLASSIVLWLCLYCTKVKGVLRRGRWCLRKNPNGGNEKPKISIPFFCLDWGWKFGKFSHHHHIHKSHNNNNLCLVVFSQLLPPATQWGFWSRLIPRRWKGSWTWKQIFQGCYYTRRSSEFTSFHFIVILLCCCLSFMSFLLV